MGDILGAIGKIEAYTRGDWDEVLSQGIAIDAVLHNLTIIGEAAAKLPQRLKEQHPEVAWSEVRGFRNVVVHAYWKIDLEILEDVVRLELPKLKAQVDAILADWYDEP